MPTGQATSRLMREAHEKGLMVYAWTVNDVDGILDLMEIGIDGLTEHLKICRKICNQIGSGRHLPPEVSSWISHVFSLRDYRRSFPS